METPKAYTADARELIFDFFCIFNRSMITRGTAGGANALPLGHSWALAQLSYPRNLSPTMLSNTQELKNQQVI